MCASECSVIRGQSCRRAPRCPIKFPCILYPKQVGQVKGFILMFLLAWSVRELSGQVGAQVAKSDTRSRQRRSLDFVQLHDGAHCSEERKEQMQSRGFVATIANRVTGWRGC